MTVEQAVGLTAIDRLKDHYKHCIRLSASNKINPKNAFDLQLIDYMQALVSSPEDGQMNFKIASSALDVGAKIYSNRVDCIQSEAQKVASSILMALDGQQGKNAGDNQDDSNANGDTSSTSDRLDDSRGENGEDGNQVKANKKKRGHRSKNVKTVVEDENLLDGKLEKMVLGDPFLDGLSRDYDMSCPAALICYNALTQPNCLLTIESCHLRKDYRDPSMTNLQPKPSTSTTLKPQELNTITEEVEDEEKDDIESKNVEEQRDEDGDTVMTDECHDSQPACDKTAIHVTPNSTSNPTLTTTVPGHTTNAMLSSSTEINNLVTLVTKSLNCAQIIRNNQNNHICPKLDNFLFNDRTTTISGLNSSNLDTSAMNQNTQNVNKTTGGAHEFNPELYDGANNDDYGDDHIGDACSDVGDENQPADARDDIIPNLDKIAASKPTEYGYSSEHHRLLNTWAGPHAWKALKVPLTAKKDVAPKSVRKRTKLEQKPINFNEEYDKDLEVLAKNEIRHSSDAIRRWKKPLLPQDHNLNEEIVRTTLIHTFMRPEDTYHCMKTPADALLIVDKDHDYTRADRNQEDVKISSPVLGGFDDVHDDYDDDDDFRADPVVDGSEVAIYGAPINNTLTQQADLEFAGEHLIEQPYTVAQVNIPFAKIAKKMDVRKLKRVMWDLLFPPERRAEFQDNNGTFDNNVTRVDMQNNNTILENSHPMLVSGDDLNGTVIMNVNPSSDEQEQASENVTKENNSTTRSESPVHLEFSNLYGKLPVRVSTKMANDLSQPIAFVTLLHLANEKNLKLIPNIDLKDFTIEQD